jgi:hypothetical protein
VRNRSCKNAALTRRRASAALASTHLQGGLPPCAQLIMTACEEDVTSGKHFNHILLAVCCSIHRHQASTPQPMLRTSSSGQSSLTRREGDKVHATKLNVLNRSCSTHPMSSSCNSGQRPAARWAAPSSPSLFILHAEFHDIK